MYRPGHPTGYGLVSPTGSRVAALPAIAFRVVVVAQIGHGTSAALRVLSAPCLDQDLAPRFGFPALPYRMRLIVGIERGVGCRSEVWTGPSEAGPGSLETFASDWITFLSPRSSPNFVIAAGYTERSFGSHHDAGRGVSISIAASCPNGSRCALRTAFDQNTI